MLLLDEITVDMDVVGRLDLLKFFTVECEARGATIVYATHIFDGLEKWVTHVAYLADGQLKIGELLLQMSGLTVRLTEQQWATLEGAKSLNLHLPSLGCVILALTLCVSASVALAHLLLRKEGLALMAEVAPPVRQVFWRPTD